MDTALPVCAGHNKQMREEEMFFMNRNVIDVTETATVINVNVRFAVQKDSRLAWAGTWVSTGRVLRRWIEPAAKYLLVAALVSTRPLTVAACDLHGVSTTIPPAKMPTGLHLGVAEQFTRFRTLQLDGHEVDNDQGESLDSAITQLMVGYRFHDRFAVQWTTPVIYRSFERVDGHDIERGTESGVGDMTLIARGSVVKIDREQFEAEWEVLAGIKFPTGDSDRLEEEHGEDHHEHPSGIHGHDLALGSGSYDAIIGSTFRARKNRWFGTAGIQYSIRSEGDHDYEFANDLAWSAGPGFYLVDHDNGNVGIQLMVSGEHKREDSVGGLQTDDTARTSFFLGPQFTATWRDRLTGLIGVDVPLDIDNSGLQIVPDLRVRAAATWTF
jgi:hypothetical protein